MNSKKKQSNVSEFEPKEIIEMWFTNQTSYSRCHSDQLLYSSLFVDFMITYTYSATFNFVFVWGSVWIYQNWKDCMTRTILETLYWKRK
jgi:hypothetical protein